MSHRDVQLRDSCVKLSHYSGQKCVSNRGTPQFEGNHYVNLKQLCVIFAGCIRKCASLHDVSLQFTPNVGGGGVPRPPEDGGVPSWSCTRKSGGAMLHLCR